MITKGGLSYPVRKVQRRSLHLRPFDTTRGYASSGFGPYYRQMSDKGLSFSFLFGAISLTSRHLDQRDADESIPDYLPLHLSKQQ